MPAAKKTAARGSRPAKKAGPKKTAVKKVATKKTGKPKAATKTGSKKAQKAAKVVGKVMRSVKGETPKEADLFAELESLAKFIQDAKKEIAALSPHEVKSEFLPSASGELDAIIEATADATNLIMDSTEVIEQVMVNMRGRQADQLMAATTKIYEACGFQDITGQRISKVVRTLQDIEEKVDGLVAVFANDSAVGRKKLKSKSRKISQKEITDEDLLNGPQASDKAKSQAEIDALLASFD